jgi:hypothetical protein
MAKLVSCARCHKIVEASDIDDYKSGFTAGYYYCGAGSWWERFSQPGETFLCDRCMWDSPLYIQTYGRVSPTPLGQTYRSPCFSPSPVV